MSHLIPSLLSAIPFTYRVGGAWLHKNRLALRSILATIKATTRSIAQANIERILAPTSRQPPPRGTHISLSTCTARVVDASCHTHTDIQGGSMNTEYTRVKHLRRKTKEPMLAQLTSQPSFYSFHPGCTLGVHGGATTSRISMLIK